MTGITAAEFSTLQKESQEKTMWHSVYFLQIIKTYA